MFDFKIGRRKLKEEEYEQGNKNITKKLDYNTLYDDERGHE